MGRILTNPFGWPVYEHAGKNVRVMLPNDEMNLDAACNYTMEYAADWHQMYGGSYVGTGSRLKEDLPEGTTVDFSADKKSMLVSHFDDTRQMPIFTELNLAPEKRTLTIHKMEILPVRRRFGVGAQLSSNILLSAATLGVKEVHVDASKQLGGHYWCGIFEPDVSTPEKDKLFQIGFCDRVRSVVEHFADVADTVGAEIDYAQQLLIGSGSPRQMDMASLADMRADMLPYMESEDTKMFLQGHFKRDVADIIKTLSENREGQKVLRLGRLATYQTQWHGR